MTADEIAIITRYVEHYPHLAVPFHNAKQSPAAARMLRRELALLAAPPSLTVADAMAVARYASSESTTNSTAS